MTVWNQLLLAMHRRCSLSRRMRSVFCTLLMLFTCGCRKQQEQLFTLGEWIQELVERSGIQVDEGSTCMDAAIAYGVIEDHVVIDPDIPLTKEWAAYTLVNLCGMDDPYTGNIKDLSEVQFEHHIRCSIPLLPLDHDCFKPHQLIEKQEAFSLLDQALTRINQRVITETKTDIHWKPDVTVQKLDQAPVMDENGYLMSKYDILPGEVVNWQDLYGQVHTAIVKDAEDGHGFTLEEADLLSLTDAVHLSGSTSVDFSKAQIMDGNGYIIQDAESSVTEQMAVRHYTSSYNIQDWKVTLSAASTGLKVEVSKEMKDGSKAYANVKLNGLKCDYEWLSEQNNLKDVYFKLSFNSEENFGVRHTDYRKLYGDFSKVDPSDFVSTVKNFFQDADHCVQKTLTLATINVPIPSAFAVSLQMKVDLNIYVSGRIEITMHQSHVLGCEIRNGSTRLIQKMNPTHTEDIRASAKASAGLRFALKMAGFELCNAALLTGVESSITTYVHLYHEDGSHTAQQTDLPADVVDELSKGNGNVLVCADLDAHLIGEVDLNTASSVAGKLGLKKTIRIFDAQNASLLMEGMKHLENFHFVNACTRKGSTQVITNDAVKVTGKITLERYAYAIAVNGYRTIHVTGMPEGYSTQDLVYESSNPDIAVVSENGRVTGRASGSAEITITTADGRHSAYVSILVNTP